MNRNSIKQKKQLFWFAVWGLSVLVMVLVVYFIPDLFEALTPTYMAQYDTVKVSSVQKCYLVKNEQVVYSQNTGAASYMYGEGSYVRKNSQLCTVNNVPYSATQPGTVSYTVDGLESYFIPGNIENITSDDADSQDITMRQLGGEAVTRGDPVFKVVDDKEWYLIFWVNEDEASNYEQGNSVEIIIDVENKISAVVENIYEQKKDYLIVLRSGDYYQGLCCNRTLDAEIITVNRTGILIKQKSIATVDGNPGVYVKQINGDYKFVRIKVLSMVGDEAVVASSSFTEVVDDVASAVSTINLYDEILKNPKNKDKGGD